MFQQEEATDTQPEQGSCHTTEAATTACPAVPALGEPGPRSQVPHSTASSEAGLGTLVQYREGRAHCTSSGRAETCRLGKGLLGSWGLSVLVLFADRGGQGLSPPAARVVLRCWFHSER